MVQASPSFTHLKTPMKSKSSMGQVTIKCTNIWTKIASASAVIANKVVLQCIWVMISIGAAAVQPAATIIAFSPTRATGFVTIWKYGASREYKLKL